jgi:DNA-binding HxlR family transcriptional regulator
MDKENENSKHDQKIDEILRKHAQLDDICREIFLTLWAYKKLRFKELQRYLKKYGTDISNEALSDHLKHLKKKKLISSKKGFQKASYGLTDEINSLLNPPEEDLKEWIETLWGDNEKLPEKFRTRPFYAKDYYDKLSEKELIEKVDKDVNRVLAHNLFELKTFIDYDLKLDRSESDVVFWNFVGNPLYRISEKRIVEDCRSSEQYREKLFEKIGIQISELRPDKKLLKEREERRKRHSRNNSIGI